jgi:aminoglycoside/choline kinase family phosphotransferase
MMNGSKLGLLDFQGVRFGPPAYDLASLLSDPYVALPYNMQKHLVEAYWLAARTFLPFSRRQFLASYRAVRLCRNLQVLGAYGFLGCVKGKTQFLRYIPRAWDQLEYCLLKGTGEQYPKLQKWVRAIHGHRRIWIGKSLRTKSFA